MRIVDRANIELRVFERGAGETLACGTGACAAMVVARLRGQVDDKVTVVLPGGRLQIAWGGAGEEVRMTGPATSVYEGHIEL
jgi:diaminopimelate epimerase